jgi:hypothetical protein
VQFYLSDSWAAKRPEGRSIASLDAPADPLDLVGLTALMSRSTGRREIRVGLIDGPVALDHPDLTAERIEPVSTAYGAVCTLPSSTACAHGTFVAGILTGRRGSAAPSLCPDCTLLVRPIFSEQGDETPGWMPSATPEELADAVRECIEAGARAQYQQRGGAALDLPGSHVGGGL